MVTRWGKVPAWWLLHDAMDADRFCVLAAMATYADETGACDPSQATLARHLKRSRPWVNRIVAELAELGFVEKTTRVRRNGGTTSCLYRLRLQPQDAAVTPATPGVTDKHTPCQPRDTSQQHLKQSQTRPPHAADRSLDQVPSEALAEVPQDWRPGEPEMQEALRLCPDADLEAHTVRFRARCQAKGYRYRPSGIGAAWLSWLLEDHPRTETGRNGGRTRSSPSARHPKPSDQATQRYAAWAQAASSPPSTWS